MAYGSPYNPNAARGYAAAGDPFGITGLPNYLRLPQYQTPSAPPPAPAPPPGPSRNELAAAYAAFHPAPPPPPPPLPKLTLATDPTYLTYLRSFNFDEDAARAAAARQVDALKRKVNLQIPQIQEAGVEQRRGIGNEAEARGVFKSGERLRKQALQRRGEESQIAGLQADLAEQTGNVQSTLEANLGQIARRRAEAAAEGQQRISEQNRYNEILRSNGLI